MIIEKSLEEVWLWKDTVYNDTKDLKNEEVLSYFKEKTDSFLKSCGFRKKNISNTIYRLEKES